MVEDIANVLMFVQLLSNVVFFGASLYSFEEVGGLHYKVDCILVMAPWPSGDVF